ncbi:hypothetical protein [Actinopolyspora halophila]|uniref:hypothetical protein n=1 Tax=Actinopolyspora halophila TaxID=1850 RepID=UPI001FE15BF3|nr:hypothetical protein [Actinopolyspora halophila]
MYDEQVAVEALSAAYPDVGSSDPVSYFGAEGNHFQGLLYAWLYWPRLVEVHGAVFVAVHGHDEAYIRGLLSTPVADGQPDWAPLSWKEVVDNFNWFEVAHLFRHCPSPVEFQDSSTEQLSEILVETWSARLRTACPDREFSVSVMDNETEDLGVEVTQVSPELEVPRGWDPQRRFIDPDV